MTGVYKYIGISLIVISVILGAFAILNKTTSEEIAVKIENQTGSCVIDGTCLHDQSNSNFIILSGISVFIFISGAIVLVLHRLHGRKLPAKELEKTQKPMKKKQKPPEILSDESKKLFAILSDSSGSMLQGELVSKSGMTKVKVSRVLDKMEMQGIIERRRHGMSNIVLLKNNE